MQSDLSRTRGWFLTQNIRKSEVRATRLGSERGLCMMGNSPGGEAGPGMNSSPDAEGQCGAGDVDGSEGVLEDK